VPKFEAALRGAAHIENTSISFGAFELFDGAPG
jgi:hypothetical protein